MNNGISKPLRVLFVGLGSIGARHLRNLTGLCRERGLALQVTALRWVAGGAKPRPLAPELEALVQRQLCSLPEGECFDLAFITNPTNLHGQILGALRGRVGCFFIEKPIFEHTGYDLDALGLGPGQKAYVAAPMRWTGLYMALKGKLAAQANALPVYSARAICSSYLPGWRPSADYRRVYSARQELGGGVTLDLIHEWDYLYDLFGAPLVSYNLRGQFSHLEIDTDDLSVYLARYPGFLCELHLDYFGRSYRRELELFSRDGSLVADFGNGMLRLPDGSTEDYSEEVNRRYQREMAYFLEYALDGATSAAESLNSPGRALAVLRIALGEN